jgi:outer membrane protein
MGTLAAGAQEPLTLRQAINQALGQSPEAAIAQAGNQDAKSASATLARTALLPQLTFTEDISRGNDPVYAFGTRLRQRQFTQADFALNALNFPQPIGNFSTRFSGQWLAFDSFKTQKEIHRADLFKKAPPPPPRRWTSRSCSALSGRTSKCCMRSGRLLSPSMSRRRRRRC